MTAFRAAWLLVVLVSAVHAEPVFLPHAMTAGPMIPFAIPARPIAPSAGDLMIQAVQAAQSGRKKLAQRLAKAADALNPKLKKAVCGEGDDGGGGSEGEAK